MSSSDYIAIAGVAANLMVVLAAILVPVWQRRAMLNDAKEAERKAWKRFIEAFRALAAAQDAVIVAGEMEHSAKAFEAVEPQLRGATEALAEASATTLPIKAVINSTNAQQKAAATLAYFPILKVYGKNMMTYSSLQAQMNDTRDATYLLLSQTESLIARSDQPVK
jgi:heme exporter protein D